MGHRVRWYVTGVVNEVTIRTLGGAFWLRPDAACKAIIEGVFGKALRLYPSIRLYAYDVQSNHLHYLFAALDLEETPLFLDYVHSNIARQINKLRKREGVFWSRRGAVIAVVDGAAQIARLRYLLSQGPKSKLVASPKDWPGACSTPALLGDLKVRATYRSLDRLRRNAQLSQPRPEAELDEDVAFTLTPLPVWADLAPATRRAKVAELIAEIEVEYRADRVMGVKRLITQDPNATPTKKLKRSPMPACHSVCARIGRRFLEAYATFRDLYKQASDRLRHAKHATQLDILKQYPPGALVRSRWYIPAPANIAATWLRGIDDADRALA